MSEAIEYLEAELSWLNLLLEREIQRLRAAYQMSLDEFRGLYVSDEQVDASIASMTGGSGITAGAAAPDSLTGRALEMRRVVRAKRSPDAPWSRLARVLELEPLEEDVLLLAAAIEYDLKYASILAYLNNDITRRFPTVDLAARLFGKGPRDLAKFRSVLRPQGRLVRLGVVAFREQPRDAPVSWRSRGFLIRQVAWDFLIDASPGQWMEEGVSFHPTDSLPVTNGSLVGDDVVAGLARCAARGRRCAVALAGREGDGRSSVAVAVGRRAGRPVITLRLAAVEQTARGSEDVLCDVELLAQLHQAVVFVHADRFDGETPRFVERLRHAGCVTLVACDRHALDEAARHVDQVVECNGLSRDERRRWWMGALGRAGLPFERGSVESLADRFVLNAGEIDRAVRVATLTRSAGNGSGEGLMAAARMVTRTNLGKMAVRVPPRIGWDQLVLPASTRRRLATIAEAIEHRRLVFEQWGFGQRRWSSGGLSILFSGSSGTGKTAAASAIAQRTGFDLYKIDLSAVVSKYIGETEKNLERIFSAQHVENAIVFFDEADALFGKRSEVKDAHDRFANIEIGYLLQKLEGHDGVVILASNLSSNIDDAFSRRIDFTVEFPVPDASLRRQLWRRAFPGRAPLAEDVRFDFLAEKFELAGGDIRNVATNAAFLAAEDGGVIDMERIVLALDAQLIKQGLVRSPTLFGPYHEVIRAQRREDGAIDP